MCLAVCQICTKKRSGPQLQDRIQSPRVWLCTIKDVLKTMLFLSKQVFISKAFQSSQEKDHSKALIEEVQIIKANTISTFVN